MQTIYELLQTINYNKKYLHKKIQIFGSLKNSLKYM